MNRQIDKMASWWKGKLTKWLVDVKANLENGKLMKQQIDKMASWWDGKLVKCVLDKKPN